MPSIVVYVPFHSPATTTFQESQMSHWGKNILLDTFKIRCAHTQRFIKTGIPLSDHTQSSSLFALAVTMLNSYFTHHQITPRLYNLVIIHRKIFLYAPQHCTGRLPERWGNSYFAVEGHLDSHERFSVWGVHCLSRLYIVTAFRGIRIIVRKKRLNWRLLKIFSCLLTCRSDYCVSEGAAFSPLVVCFE